MIELSDRQYETMNLYVYEGKTLKEISDALEVSYSRVTNILNEVLIKTGLKNKRELLVKGKEIEFTKKNIEIDVKKALKM